MTTESDRELLELAAKAMGFSLDFEPTYREQALNQIGPWRDDGWSVQWNPLTDDGDALRLAVKLNFAVSVAAREAGNVTVFDDFGIQVFEPLGDDPCAATRRAIVRAAAEIARATHKEQT